MFTKKVDDKYIIKRMFDCEVATTDSDVEKRV